MPILNSFVSASEWVKTEAKKIRLWSFTWRFFFPFHFSSLPFCDDRSVELRGTQGHCSMVGGGRTQRELARSASAKHLRDVQFDVDGTHTNALSLVIVCRRHSTARDGCRDRQILVSQFLQQLVDSPFVFLLFWLKWYIFLTRCWEDGRTIFLSGFYF